MKIRAITILFLILTAVFGLTSWQDASLNKRIEGDLYFSFFRFGSFYDQPDSVINKFKIYADTVERKTITASDKQVLLMYETLKKENLLSNPYVQLQLEKDSIIWLYLDKSEYDKIKIYKRKELQDNNKKIRIKVEIKDLGNKMVLCKKLISVDKIDGQTLQSSRKLRIEDYR